MFTYGLDYSTYTIIGMDFRIILLLLPSIVLGAEAEPKCTTYRATDVVCVAGDEDYVLQRGLVSDNNKTTGITLRGCRITDIEFESFTNLPNLKYLDLSENKINNIKLGVLDEPHQVTYLNISSNNIKRFPLGLFDQIINIDVLDLRSNEIVDIELGVFDTLKKLKHIDLSNNSIVGRNLNPYIFDQSTLIKFMDFSRNDMSNSSDELLNAVTILEFLNLDRCSLDIVPTFLKRANLNTLKHLILSTNKIKNIDDASIFTHLISLEKLNLADNSIESLHEELFQPLKNLRTIILRNNKLKILPDKLFQNLSKLGTIVMSHNTLEHFPVNALRGTSLKTLIISYNKLTYLQDNFCLELRNSGGSLKKFLFNDNPWQCACLRDILKEVKEYQIEYQYAKYNGQSPVCATTEEFYCKRQQSFNQFYVQIYDNSV